MASQIQDMDEHDCENTFQPQQLCTGDGDDMLMATRKMILTKGLPSFDDISDQRVRREVWKLLLGVGDEMHVNDYIDLVKRGKSPFDDKIRDDSFRTFKGLTIFWERVDEGQMVRILNALANDNDDASKTEKSNEKQNLCYVQGMNVLLGPILFVMPELDAYRTFSCLMKSHCPRYAQKNLEGVHRGCQLLERLLRLLDIELFQHIHSRIPNIEIFAFSSVLTMMAASQPFTEVLKLWDAIFAFGVHFSLLLYVSQLMAMRKTLLLQSNAYKLQRLIQDAHIDARALIRCSLSLVQSIPLDLFDELIRHPVE